MSKETILFIIGLLVLVSPFLGIPVSWLSVLLPILGAIILVIAYLNRREHTPRTLHIDEAPHSHNDPSAIA